MKPEHRIRVLDLSTHWSGSVASRHLAHLGAEVVKLENPTFGDGNRGLEPLVAGQGISHLVLNACKQSVTADRRAPDWAATLRHATQWADVVIVGSQPGVARARGLDFDSFVAMNSQIVYCNISGYGEVGPWADYPLHGLNGDVVAGLVPVEMQDGMPVPRADYRSVGTTLSGVEAAVGILEGLRRRDLGMGPQSVTTSVWESSMFWQWRDMMTSVNTNQPATAYGDLGSRYAMYATSDDRVVLICPVERKFWEAFCDLVDLPTAWKSVGSWGASGMDWGRGRTDERQLIAERMRARPLSDWLVRLEGAGIPFSPLLTVKEAAETEHARAVGVMATMTVNGVEVMVPNIPLHLSSPGQAEGLRGPHALPAAPALGADTQDFLGRIS